MLVGGCARVLTPLCTVGYDPVAPPLYTETVVIPVAVGAVKDQREMGARAYCELKSYAAMTSRPIAEIVEQAVRTELSRRGLQITSPDDPAVAPVLAVDCDILAFAARITQAWGESNRIETHVSVRFRWTDAATGVVVSDNVRTEKRSWIVDYRVTLPFARREIIALGDQLVNIWLTRVIEQEIRFNERLR